MKATTRTMLRVVCRVGQAIVVLIGFFFAYASDWSPSDRSGDQVLWAVLSRAEPYGTMMVAVAGAALWLLEVIHTQLKRVDSRAVASRLLDDLRVDVFGDEEGEIHHHRATLFGWKREYLHIWARSGHTTQRSRTKFHAPRSDPDRAEGVAGRCWAKGGGVAVTGLPDISAIPFVTRERPGGSLQDYATKTWVTPDWLRRRLDAGQILARSFLALPVEVDGAPWGVIVLDSRNPKGPDPARTEARFRHLSRVLGRLIERGVI